MSYYPPDHMAHFDEPYRPWRKPQTVGQIRAWGHVAHVFGRRPSSIRSLSDEVDAHVVKLEWDLTNSFEFIYASGLLVGMPQMDAERSKAATTLKQL